MPATRWSWRWRRRFIPRHDQKLFDEKRRALLEKQANELGLPPDEIDRAIRDLEERSSDLFQQGSVALYENNLDRAAELLRRSYESKKAEGANNRIASAQAAFFLARALYEQGEYDASANRFREVAAIKSSDFVTLNWIGHSKYSARGMLSDYKNALDVAVTILNEENPDNTLNLASADFRDPSPLPKAQPTAATIPEPVTPPIQIPRPEPPWRRLMILSRYQKALEMTEKALGQNHPYVAGCLENLTTVYLMQNEEPKALPLLNRSIEINQRNWGTTSFETAVSLVRVAKIYKKYGKFRNAESYFKRAVPILEILSKRKFDLLMALDGYADLLKKWRARMRL